MPGAPEQLQSVNMMSAEARRAPMASSAQGNDEMIGLGTSTEASPPTVKGTTNTHGPSNHTTSPPTCAHHTTDATLMSNI